MTGQVVRAGETAVSAAVLAAMLVGLSLTLLVMPVFTTSLVRGLAIPASAGLPTRDAVRLAAQVRGFVADSRATRLPGTWRGAVAFDERAVSHLADVRRAIAGARAATGIACALAALWVGWCVGAHRLAAVRRGMRAGAYLTAALVGLAGVAALTDFSGFFSAFHGVLFADGSWLFDPGSLLIRLFPERFWVWSGFSWAALSLCGAALLAGAARLVRADERSAASQGATNV